VTMAAGVATLTQLTPEKYPVLADKTRLLAEGLKTRADSAKVPFQVNYQTGMFGLFFTHQSAVTSFSDVMQCDSAIFAQFFNTMLNAGVYFAPSAYEAGFISLAHSDQDIQKTLDAAEKAFATI